MLGLDSFKLEEFEDNKASVMIRKRQACIFIDRDARIQVLKCVMRSSSSSRIQYAADQAQKLVEDFKNNLKDTGRTNSFGESWFGRLLQEGARGLCSSLVYFLVVIMDHHLTSQQTLATTCVRMFHWVQSKLRYRYRSPWVWARSFSRPKIELSTGSQAGK
jgi:hypothetical protein